MVFGLLDRKARNIVNGSSSQELSQARAKSTARIVARFSRGNIMLQRGAFMTADDLRKRSEAADDSMAEINKVFKTIS